MYRYNEAMYRCNKAIYIKIVIFKVVKCPWNNLY